MTRKQALANLIDQSMADHDRAEKRGQFKAAAKHLARAGRFIAELNAA